jgi:hypothetical protein
VRSEEEIRRVLEGSQLIRITSSDMRTSYDVGLKDGTEKALRWVLEEE